MVPKKDRPELTAMLKRAAAQFAAMPRAEQDAMLRRQIDGVARAEASWPSDCPHR